MTVYLGAPDPQWLGYTDRPLMVSHNRLRRIKSGFSFPICHGSWILDSGAYDVITRHGRYLDTAEEYVRAVRAYDIRIGNLMWCAPQDVPCESKALAATGATVIEHQEWSIRSYIDVTALWERLAHHRASPFRPVLQGRTPEEYLRCWDRFARLGVDLTQFDVIGVGSVCRRERTDDIREVVAALRQRTTGRIHGYGVKAEAVGLFDDVDSMAWSKIARVRQEKHPNCTAFHRVCSSCLVYAEDWHDHLIDRHATARAAA